MLDTRCGMWDVGSLFDRKIAWRWNSPTQPSLKGGFADRVW